MCRATPGRSGPSAAATISLVFQVAAQIRPQIPQVRGGVFQGVKTFAAHVASCHVVGRLEEFRRPQSPAVVPGKLLLGEM